MKLLFLMDGALDPGGATQTLSFRLCEALAQQGHTVFVLESSTGESARKNIAVGSVHIVQFMEKTEKPFIDWVFEQQKQGHSTIETALGMLSQPKKLLVALQWGIFKKRPLEQAYIKNIAKLHKEQHFDWVVAASAPHYTSFALGKTKKASFKKALYWLDPFSTKSHSKESQQQHKEIALLKKVDKVFVTELMYKENRQNALRAFLPKMQALPFPILVEHANKCPRAPVDEKNIRCVFVGRFASKIREPKPLIDLFLKLPKNFHLVLVGDNSYFQEGKPLEHYAQKLGDRLTITGFVPLDEAFAQMHKADILVNLGNLNENQLPSKIFDYISTGKPILNLYQIENCPTLPVLKQYPLALSVSAFNVQENTLAEISSFCKENLGKKLDFSQLEKIHNDYTPQSVARHFCEFLEDFY